MALCPGNVLAIYPKETLTFTERMNAYQDSTPGPAYWPSAGNPRTMVLTRAVMMSFRA